MKRKITMLAGCLLMLLINACKKDVSPPATKTNSSVVKNTNSTTAIPDGYTLTSVGLIPDSNITVIEEGYKLAFLNGRAYKLHIASGKLVRDLGTIVPYTANKTAAPNSIAPQARSLNGLGGAATFGTTSQGWVTYAQWTNPSPGNPITNFTSNFTVPIWPTTQSNQIFAIWMGLEPSFNALPLIQPLLIWGNSGGKIGGGQSWTLVSYVIWISSYYNGQPVYSAGISTPVHNVSPLTALSAQISYVSNSGVHMIINASLLELPVPC